MEIQKYTEDIIGIPISVLTFDEQVNLIIQWANSKDRKLIFLSNIYKIVKAHQNIAYKETLDSADLVLSSSMSLVWMLKFLGYPSQEWISYNCLLEVLCERAQRENVSVFFIGPDSCLLKKMYQLLTDQYPSLTIGGMEVLTDKTLPEESSRIIDKINNSNSSLLLVALDSPLQEIWLNQNRNKINSTMIGLGGAFRVYSNQHNKQFTKGVNYFLNKPRRRLLHYLTIVIPFILLAFRQLAGEYFINNLEDFVILDKNEDLFMLLKEEWLFDLREQKARFEENKLPKYLIKIKIKLIVLDMYFAFYKIKFEERWLPKVSTKK